MRYDKEGDVLDLLIKDGQIHHAEDYDQIIVNFDKKIRVVEMEILNASEFGLSGNSRVQALFHYSGGSGHGKED